MNYLLSFVEYAQESFRLNKDGPCAIKELVIDRCNMDDTKTAVILRAILEQKMIESISISNVNWSKKGY